MQLSRRQAKFVNRVREVCRNNYDAGGDIIIETYSDEEILEQFKSIKEVRDFIGLRVEDETNKRWGEDDDPELARLKRFEKAEWTE